MTIRNDISYNLSLIKKEVIRWHWAVQLIYTVTLNKRIVQNNRNLGRTSHLRRLRRDLNELPGYCYCSLGSITIKGLTKIQTHLGIPMSWGAYATIRALSFWFFFNNKKHF